MMKLGTHIPAHGTNGIDVAVTQIEMNDARQLAATFAQMPPWSVYPYPASKLADYFSSHETGAPRFALTLANEPGTIVGVVGLSENWLHGPYVQFLGITDGFQSRGIGTAVLSKIETVARQSGARNFWVIASSFNTRAISFYQRSGFEIAAELDGIVQSDQTEVLLRKRLNDTR